MSRILSFFSTLLITSLLTGCIAFQKNNLKEKNIANFAVDSKQKLKVYAKWDFDFMPVQYSELTYEGRADIFRKVISDSGCCELVQKKKDADLIIEGKAYNERDNLRFVGWFISALTLYIIPSWHEAQIFVSAKVKNNDTSKDYNITGDSIVTAIWAPLIVVSPIFINSLNKAEKQTMENSYRALFVQMKRDGLMGSN